MAESLGELYARIGLNFDDLENSFVEVERTLNQNISRLNKEQNLVKLQAQVEMLGLDKATDATAIFEITQKSLQKQIDISNQKLKLMSAELDDTRKRTGANSVETQKAAERYEKARLAVGKLQMQLKRLVQENDKAAQSAKKSAINYQKLFDAIGVRTSLTDDLGITAKLGDLRAAVPALEGGINKITGALDKIPGSAKVAVAALVALPVAVKAAEDAILSIAEPAITAGDAFYVASRGAQMTIKDFEELSTICKVTGIELGEVTNVMKRLDMQLVKSADGKVAETLKKYGVEVRKANGELKNALDMSIALAEGLGKAQAEGKGKDFIAATLGKGASGDIVTYLEDISDNIKAAKEIVRNGLFDPVRAHNIQGEINKMNTQAEQLGSAFSSAFYPVVEILVPKLRERLGDLTQVIQDNANGIKNIGYAVAKVVGHVGDLTTKIIELGTTGLAAIGNTYAAETEAQTKKYREMAKIKTETEFLQQELLKESPVMRESLKNNSAYLAKIRDEWKKAKQFREETEAELRHANTKELKRHEKDIQKAAKETEESLEKSKHYLEEIQKLKINSKFQNDDYGKDLAQLSLWYEKELAQVEKSEKLKTELTELYNLKRSEIVNKYRDKSLDAVKKLNEEVANIEFSKTHTEFEKQLRDIELWKQAQLEKARTAEEVAAIISSSAKKESDAFDKEMDKIRGKIQSLQEKIFLQEHSKRENDIMKVQKEAYDYLSQGLPKVDIARWYSNELKKLRVNPLTVQDYWADVHNKSVIRAEMNKPSLPDIKEKLGDLDLNIVPSFDKLKSTLDNSLEPSLIRAGLAVKDFSDNLDAAKVKINLPANVVGIKEMNQELIPTVDISKLAEVTKMFGDIARSLAENQRNTQPPQVTVNYGDIKIDLGGAYVFDNEMKDRLTSDIATEVANEITTAVQRATNNLNFARRP